MPLVQRAIEPYFTSRKELDKSVKNELEGVVANTLGELIRQLSSLSKHAENLFGELLKDANAIYDRSNKLNTRIEVLVDRVTKLDPVVEQVRIEDVSTQSHYKSSQASEQQVLDRNTLSTALIETYRSCDAPPLLDEFTRYRDDGRHGLTFFTDPKYFFNLWLEEQNRQIEKRRKRDKKNRKKKSNAPQKRIKKAERKRYNPQGKEFEETSSRPPPPKPPESRPNGGDAVPPEPQPSSMSGPSQPPPPPPPSVASGPTAPPPPPPPPPPPTSQSSLREPPPPSFNSANVQSNTVVPKNLPDIVKHPPPVYPMSTPPPPPPPPPSVTPNLPPPPPPPPTTTAPPTVTAAPVNLPPPGPAPPPPPPVPTVFVGDTDGTAVQSQPVEVKKVQVPDQRSDLLQAIIKGKQLRKVEKTEENRKTQRFVGTDVASILARRIAVEMTDSESESTDGEWDDDDDWED